MKILPLLISVCLGGSPVVLCAGASSQKVKTLYSSLSPRSAAQHLAFYELYPHTPEGQHALADAWNLLAGVPPAGSRYPRFLPPNVSTGFSALINLINKLPGEAPPQLTEEELQFIEVFAKRLPNRKLRGFQAVSEQEVLRLTADEIDLTRGLLLSEMGESPDTLKKIRSYEATLDLMALQILVNLSLRASPKEKIRALNSFIFDEMRYRFPPHSIYAKNIDVYTFLPAVVDSRKGVCLGVSILYMCLAQRLGLSLELITPPGHIYVRYKDKTQEINIETTARGIHLDSEEYLGMNTRALEIRNVKDVIGLAHFNQASVFWQQDDHEKALECYAKAQKYLPDDQLLKELMGYNYLMAGKLQEGAVLLKEIVDYVPEHAVVKETMAEDYLNGKVNVEGLKIVYQKVDEKRESILKKKMELETILKTYPEFRAGIFSLAVAWFQLHREREALELLQRYHRLFSGDPSAEYYLASLYCQRMDFQTAWKHLKNAEQIVKQRNHYPRALKELRREIAQLFPEPEEASQE